MKKSKIKKSLPAGRQEKSKTHIKIQNCLKIFKFWFVILIFNIYILNFIGCARIKEIAKSVAGVSTKVLEDGRKDAIKKTFNCDHNTCYNKVLEKLKQIGAYIYAKDKRQEMLAVYVSITDTTPVGIFFKELAAKNIQIEVSSPSTYAKEFISTKIFLALEPEPKEK
jgi:hypothetical protein